MRNFFGYLTYDSIQHYNASPSVIFNQLNQTAAPNIVTKTFSRTGWVYYNLIKDICSSTGIDEGRNELPGEFQLYQNYPNPFNPATIISWQSPVSSHQTLKIYDVLGNEVATLVNEFLPAGIYEAEFNASGLASGLYLYRLQTVGFVETKKMILMK
ncbi:MAG: T9SS type A sorting domain-containing protein [Ignavibacteriaceae bacterium]|nr:T9SS type A sorting domain-containing protein [Ignavibacteriaceae bacterium]